MSLNLKQKSFCEEYVRQKGNATKAYMSAYGTTNYKTAGANGYKLLKNTEINEYISYLNDEVRSDLIADATEIQVELSKIIRNKLTQDKDKIAASKLLLESQGGLTNKIKLDADVTSKVTNIFSNVDTSDLLSITDKFDNFLDEEEGD